MISVVIRCKDEAPSIGRVLELLSAQTVTPQVVVVDSGSTDGTVDIVRRHGVDELIEIPAESFTYGGALNTGTERATEEVVVALSAHSFPKDDAWLARVLDAMADERVACASGQGSAPDGAPLHERVVQDLALAEAHPLWGYSSHAGAFRRSLWSRRPFRPDMAFSEDKEWALHWLRQGYLAVLGPDLTVHHSHNDDPARVQYTRERLAWASLREFTEVPRLGLPELARRWWTDREVYGSAWRARLSPKRLGRLGGEYVGRRP